MKCTGITLLWVGKDLGGFWWIADEERRAKQSRAGEGVGEVTPAVILAQVMSGTLLRDQNSCRIHNGRAYGSTRFIMADIAPAVRSVTYESDMVHSSRIAQRQSSNIHN